jgi:NAD(P)-dependent dehydrogenase (short-subunit alcohol dehydrogenase family)
MPNPSPPLPGPTRNYRSSARSSTGRSSLFGAAPVTSSSSARPYRSAGPPLLDAEIPAGRWAEPAEIAGAALLLTGSASGYLTGVILPVDGGWTAH